MYKVLIVLGSKSDMTAVVKGLEVLKQLNVSYSLRIASAHRTPDHLDKIVNDFEQQGGQIFVCVAGMSAHLAGVIAAKTTKPVIAVPLASATTAGFDSLLSMSQMPPGVPVATMGFGTPGFVNGVLMACQILSLGDAKVLAGFAKYRHEMAAAVISSDTDNRMDFTGE